MSETVFSNVQYTLGGLLQRIEMGELALPDLQRPFVWKNAKVRDLFDSMYRGYPVGYFLFWQSGLGVDSRAVGTDPKQKSPSLLIVDGQQRLTSLYAVFNGVEVIRENFKKEHIQIAFNPLEERFEVWDAAVAKDKAFIPNISALWADDADIFTTVGDYLESLRAVRDLTSEEDKRIKKALNKVANLNKYPFTALELGSDIDEEQVSEVFVRVNSAGKPLNQADFILTLMSVFWDEGRRQLEDFCREARIPSKGKPSPFNHFIDPAPDQLLRVGVGLAFKRARLKSVYSLLRGKDLDTGGFSDIRREDQFQLLKGAQEKVLNVQYWHDFMKAILLAGFRSEKMIGSKNALLFAYTFYLIGRTEFGVDENDLRHSIAKWFFMSAITKRYTSSPESAMDFDLATLREVKDSDGFLAALDSVCRARLSQDYWDNILVTDLATSSSRSPAQNAYHAALNILEAPALYSKHKASDLFDPSLVGTRASLERHHLWPKAFLKRNDISSVRETNQIANFALVEWHDNGKVSDKAPEVYVPELEKRFSEKELEEMYRFHALPPGWVDLEYKDFLARRRVLMAEIVQEGYELLVSGERPTQDSDAGPSVYELVELGESMAVEFKATLRFNNHSNQFDKDIEYAIIRTVAGFLNAHGGDLVIGIADDGEAVGLGPDGFKSEDAMALHLTSILRSKLGAEHLYNVHPNFEDYEEERILRVRCAASRAPVYVNDGKAERFYVRTGPSTSELSASQMQRFIEERFKSL